MNCPECGKQMEAYFYYDDQCVQCTGEDCNKSLDVQELLDIIDKLQEHNDRLTARIWILQENGKSSKWVGGVCMTPKPDESEDS